MSEGITIKHYLQTKIEWMEHMIAEKTANVKR